MSLKVVKCRHCGTDRWDGIGPCGTCGGFQQTAQYDGTGDA